MQKRGESTKYGEKEDKNDIQATCRTDRHQNVACVKGGAEPAV